MESYSYKLTDVCAQDIDDVLGYITNTLCNPSAAKRIYNGLNAIIKKACSFPLMYPNCNIYLIADDNIRYAFVDSFVLIYEVDDENKQLNLLRFLYSARDIKGIE